MALLVALTCAAYWPVFHNGFIWDDPEYVINNRTLRSPGGLAAMWTDITALPQWYPMTHTVFWVEYHLWGADPLGYHVVNVLLHVAAALLLWRLLVRLAVPGAYLAALLFAVHPVHVESVAWITERKNTLSTLFYFAAALAFLRTMSGRRLLPDGADVSVRRGDAAWPLIAVLLFAAAVLSKSMACTLPAALLLVYWWRHGRIAMRDVLPLLPMFLIGLAMARVTAWLEVNHVGATGPRWTFAPTLWGEFVFRTLVAGRVLWFYAGKLIAPINLAFIYPRWHVDRAVGWQYLFPLAAIACLIALWSLRHRIGRGPLAAVLFFVGTLTPALGYFNVYPMQFSFVADHFQHLASVGLTTLAAAGLALLIRRRRTRAAAQIVAGVVVIALAILTEQQCLVYHDPLTLWGDAVRKNPQSWVTQFNLGRAIIDSRDDEARFADAEPFFLRALRNGPDIPDTHVNVGIGYVRDGRFEDARREFLEALKLKPDFAVAYLELGKLTAQEGKTHEAEEYFKQALAIIPGFPEAHAAYARMLTPIDPREAVDHWHQAVINEPENSEYRYDLGTLQLQLGMFDGAADSFRVALQYAPEYVEAWTNLGAAELHMGDTATAADAFEHALRLRPGFAPAEAGLRRARGQGK